MSSLIVKICKVENVTKHPNADRLSIATVGGWNCIVGLDQYKTGDKVVFIPPDCVIPNNLIEKYNLEYLKHNGRTGTVKLRGYISQGLILDVPEGSWKVGDDVANAMGITKYEQPEPKFSIGGARQSTKRKLNPLFDKYTDIENINNFNDVFKDGDLVVVTEKIHGCNGRWSLLPIAYSNKLPLIEKIKFVWNKYILKKKFEFVYGSHNVQLTSDSRTKNFYGDDVWGKIAKKYDLANKISENTIVYGEVYGEGIQDLTYGLKGIDFAIFDIKRDGIYLNWEEVVNYCIQHGLPNVPMISCNVKFDKNKLKDWTDGKSFVYKEQFREGCVIKPMIEENDPRIGRKILKSVSTEYLTRKGGTEFQ
jgi:RNA ligase (TIGR02306 family)